MQSEQIKLLNHGFVRMVDSMGDDLSISRNARVSYDAEWRAGEDSGSDSRLISYLKANGHNTPFESVVFTFDVKAPIFVFRQWHRHRTQSYNELSARYRELPEEFYEPEPHLVGKQNKDNKQMRDPLTKEEYEALPLTDREHTELMLRIKKEANVTSFKAYKRQLEMGMPRELARGCLPFDTYSHMFTTVNLHNLFHFLGERLHTHAQYEIRVYAEAILELIRDVVPVAVAAFESSKDTWEAFEAFKKEMKKNEN